LGAGDPYRLGIEVKLMAIMVDPEGNDLPGFSLIPFDKQLFCISKRSMAKEEGSEGEP